MNYITRVWHTFLAFLSRSGQLRHTFGLIALVMMTWLTLSLTGPAANAQDYTKQVIHAFDFTGGTDTGTPSSSLINIGGTLYGTGSYGGINSGGSSSRCGAIYSINPATNQENVIYTFKGNPIGDGWAPGGNLAVVNGIIYGTTHGGGSTVQQDPHGVGTIFSLDPATHTEHILHQFTGIYTINNDGIYPEGGLTAVNVNGTTILFGVTFAGGTNGDGTIFSIHADGTGYQTLYQFTDADGDGAYPTNGLTLVNGRLYGTTTKGGIEDSTPYGSQGFGTIFSIDPVSHTYTVVYQFQGSATSDGDGPDTDLLNVNGMLYGSTFAGGILTPGNDDWGGGTLYSFDPSSGTEHILYRFNEADTSEGYRPSGNLLGGNGILVGTTTDGGLLGGGTVFAINTDGTGEQVLYGFGSSQADGTEPANLFDLNGTLYGTALGGADFDGIVFTMSAPGMTTPSAASDSYTATGKSQLTAAAPGVLANDHSGNSSFINATLVTGTTHGRVTLHGDGSFQYIPNAGFAGTDTFTYRIANPKYQGNTTTVHLTVITAPIAKNDSNVFKYNTPLTINAPGVLNDDDNGGSSPMTATLVTGTAHGTVTLSSNGGYKYTPNAGYVGNDSFTYQAVNPIGKSNIAKVTLVFQPVAPTAKNDAGRCQHNTTLTITASGVLGNDSTGGSPTTASIVTNPTHGTITFHSDGSFVYKPTTGFIGTDSFTYKDTNSVGISNTATCTLTVQ